MELGQTRAGWLVGSQFVYSQHCKSCRTLGMAEDKIAAISAWAASDQFEEVERLVLAYTDALVLEKGRVPDALFAALADHLTGEQIIELTYITMMYEMHAVMSRALRTEFDDRDDPVVEVPGPADSSPAESGTARVSGVGQAHDDHLVAAVHRCRARSPWRTGRGCAAPCRRDR
ncbi:MAG: hypothetical protein WKF58_08205 [Ilumatobacteraceae bacterium]